MVRSSEDDFLYGVIFDIEDNEVCKLDRAEGVGNGYHVETFELPPNAPTRLIRTYVADSEYINEALIPYSWYRDLVLAGVRQHGFPADYLAGLSCVPFTEDPDPNRKERLSALEALRAYSEFVV
jgi:hypothetical protein